LFTTPAQAKHIQYWHRHSTDPAQKMLTTPPAALCGILPYDWKAASATTNM